MSIYMCVLTQAWTRRWSLFLTPCQRRYQYKGGFWGGLPPTHRYEAVMGWIAAFIEWHLFSPTLYKCSEQNRQGAAEEDIFFAFVGNDRHAAITLSLSRHQENCHSCLALLLHPCKLPLAFFYVSCRYVWVCLRAHARFYKPHAFGLYVCVTNLQLPCSLT